MFARWARFLRQPLPEPVLARSILGRVPGLRRLPGWGWLLIFLAILGAAVAAFIPVDVVAMTGTPLDTAVLVISVALKLGAVLGLLLICLAVFQRWQSGFRADQNRRITIVETVRLTPRQAVHLVRIDQREILIGATDQGLTLLSHLTSSAEQKDDRALNSRSEFSDLFLSRIAD